MDEKQFIRNFKAFNRKSVDIFLGAGASFSSGIATGSDLVWYFKREIYCSENNISQDRFKDLKSETNRKILQDYFSRQSGYPQLGNPEEYSFYFERCFSSPAARKNFIDNQVVRRIPNLGYLCLANLIIDSKIDNIWTTNFDELSEIAIRQIDYSFPLNVISSANKKALTSINPNYSSVYKLHGDYRYDKLQNTTDELQELENDIANQLYTKLLNRGLVVVGYSGSDESVMGFFEKHVADPNFLSKGLYWTTIKGRRVSDRVLNLIETLNGAGKEATIFEIENFDAFLYNIYVALNYKNEIIDKQASLRINAEKFNFNLPSLSYFIKLNAYEVKSIPNCNIFETDIKDWHTLKALRGELIAALFNGKVYSLSAETQLREKFGTHIKSEIKNERISESILRRNDSIYTGMLYDLIAKALIEKGLVRYRKTKFYEPSSAKREGIFVFYEAIDIGLEYIGEKYYLNLCPTYHVTFSDGRELDRIEYQKKINSKSNIYNDKYADILFAWQGKLIKNNNLIFEYNGIVLEFCIPAVSCGGLNNKPQWIKKQALRASEPVMMFSNKDRRLCTINQLKGLVKYGPIDYSYAREDTTRPPIRLAAILPDRAIDMVLNHLNALNTRHQSDGKDAFLQNYEGFTNIYKSALMVPTQNSTNIVSYEQDKVFSYSAKEFVNFLKNQIDRFALNRTDFDVLIIYIPKTYQKFRTALSISADFDLHDAIKLYATDKGVPVQFIEEKSVKSVKECKVFWGLSTALYAKAHMGVLWQPQAIIDNTAYIGISYAISKENGICIGCSQLFDSTGTGMRMLLRKIESPEYAGKRNPYMNRVEARNMMCALREEYYRCNPTAKLDRIVIHKTTPFMKDEIIGFVQAFEGIADIELIQIQEFNHWKGIKFDGDYKDKADSFPMERGTVIPISDDSFLLWTHGCIQHRDLGYGRYYKNSRGTPTPLVVKRFYGNSSGEIIANEILMLTKMNWNSGDSLYKVLPVTLDFAKVLSRMSKQNEAIYNKAYDFRYFM